MGKRRNLCGNQRVNLRSNQGGFVIIVALGMILLMAVFAISLQQMTISRLNHMKEMMNLFDAQIFTDSSMEYLQHIVKEKGGAGLASGEIVCNYGEYAEDTSSDNAATGSSNIAYLPIEIEGGGAN